MTFLSRALFALSLLAWSMMAAPAALAAGCPAAPPAPKLPVGCRGMDPTCICDVQGNCHWEFLCVRE